MLQLHTLFSASARHALLMTAAGFGLVLTGCASTATSKVAATTQVQYYPACYEPVKSLRSSDDAMKKSVATGAVVGGLLGGIAGGLTGDRSKMGRNMAIGVAGGAIAGGAAGYYTEKQKQITDDKQRLASYATDIDRSTGELDRNVAYAQASQSCYQAQFANLLTMRKANTVSDAEGRQRLAEIVAGLKESNDLLVAADGRAATDADSYNQAYDKDLQQVGVQRAQVDTVVNNDTAAKKLPVSRLPKVPQEAVATGRTLQKNSASRAQSQKVASSGKTMVQNVCTNADMGDWAPPSCKAPA